jgi:hypothetical protein
VAVIGRRNLSVRGAQGVTLGVTAAYVVGIAILWNVRSAYLQYAMWPFKVSLAIPPPPESSVLIKLPSQMLVIYPTEEDQEHAEERNAASKENSTTMWKEQRMCKHEIAQRAASSLSLHVWTVPFRRGSASHCPKFTSAPAISDP